MRKAELLGGLNGADVAGRVFVPDRAAFRICSRLSEDTAEFGFARMGGLAGYLSRYTHRVAISNRRLVAADDGGVSFRWKDYRIKGPGRWKTMTLTPHEFIRRFLMHVLPKGFHRIRHYGLLANGNRAANIAHARKLLAMPPKEPETDETAKAAEPDVPSVLPRPCPCCGGRMFIIETFARGCEPKHRSSPAPLVPQID